MLPSGHRGAGGGVRENDKRIGKEGEEGRRGEKKPGEGGKTRRE